MKFVYQHRRIKRPPTCLGGKLICLPSPPLPSLREQEVVTLLAMGHTHREIPDILGLSLLTTDTYIHRLKKKWRVKKNSELVDIAFENDYVDFPWLADNVSD